MLNKLQNHTSTTYALMRIAAGALMLPHGGQKLFGWFGGMDGNGATVELVSKMGLAGTLEFFAGSLVLLGLFTRPAAFLLSGLMAAAYFMSHFPNGFLPLTNRGELALLYAFTFLYIASVGSGAFSIDSLRKKSE